MPFSLAGKEPDVGTGFVVGFGGTGARCLEALTYVASSGGLAGPLHTLMVDPDASNGNLRQLKEQLGRYHTVQAEVAKAGAPDTTSLFSLPINKEDGESSYAWEYPSSQLPFATLLNL